MNSFCDYFNSEACRSCSEISVPYEEQLAKKEARTLRALASVGVKKLEPTVRSAEVGFRNRAKMSITGSAENPVIGLLGEDSLDEGRELLGCPIHHPKLNLLIGALPRYIREFNLIPYRIAERTGELKSVILFYSPETDESYLRFVLRSQECVSRIRKLIPELQSEFPGLVVITANLQPVPHAILEGREEIYLTERHSLEHRAGVRTFNLSPQGFVQTNMGVATLLYTEAAAWIRGLGAARVLDLFCGQGAFSFFASDSATDILGIDFNAEGIAAANESAKIQRMKHLRFIAADAANVSKVADDFNPDLILVNPPRRGLGRTTDLLVASNAPWILYSSCSLESLASDLERMAADFTVTRVKIFDLFPHTEHFEILTLLARKHSART